MWHLKVLTQTIFKTYFGLSKPLVTLFSFYFCDRRQYVVYKVPNLKVFKTKSGVPQGFNLERLLYEYMTNFLPEVVKCFQSQLFAGDFKAYIEINTI